MLKFIYMRAVLYLVLTIVLLNAIVLDKAVNLLPLKELKRRARSGHDKRMAQAYRLAAYTKSLSIFLWLSGSVAAALLFVLLIGDFWWLAVIYVGLLAWLIRGWQTGSSNDIVWNWAAFSAPSLTWLMVKLQPILGRLGKTRTHQLAAGVYEKDDLIELLQAQAHQPDNRIPRDELEMAANAITFGDKKVADVMTPLRKMRVVSEDEQVGPLLMDELHKTGFSRFPVMAAGNSQAQSKVIGTLFLRDIIGYEGHSRVRDLMHKKVYFINEAQSLRGALNAFIKNHYHLFVVVNNFEEIVGVVTIEDVLEQIVGRLIVDEFDRYDDLRAVAGLEAKAEQAKHQHVPTTEQTAESVVN